MTTTICIRDSLRAAAEAESGGKQTILYTVKGQPSYMNVIPAFNCEDLGPSFGTGRHPAFVVDGVEKSEIFIGTYQASVRSGEALSLPCEDPATGMKFDAARAACAAAGPGWHLMTAWEWAAIALWCSKNGFGQMHGNTDYGKSHLCPEESGIVSKHGRTLTGSGPDTWRHDGTPFGIDSLVGNVWEWNDGLKLVDGRILMAADNDYLMPEAAWPDTGAKISANDGIEISDVNEDPDYDSVDFSDVTIKPGYELPLILKQALLCPVAGQGMPGYFWADSSEGFEALPIRGGCWLHGDNAGLAALLLDSGRSDSSVALGFRPAFIG